MNEESHKKDLPVKKGAEMTDPLEQVELSGKQVVEVIKESGAKIIAGLVGLGGFVGALDTLDQKIKEEKIKILLTQFQTKFEDINEALNRLKSILGTRAGVIIFQKVIHILDNGDVDMEWIDLLAKVLKKISDDDFEKYFEERTFLLAQIAKLSPQALILLSKYEVWRQANIQSTTTTSGITAGDWIPQTTRFLMSKMGKENLHLGARVNHSFHELESAGMVKLNQHQVKLTAIGMELQRALE